VAAPVPDYLAGLAAGISGVRIGVDADYNETGCDAQVVMALRAAAKVLESLGGTLHEVRLPSPGTIVTAWNDYCSVEAAISHEATYPARAAEYATLANVLDAGRAVRAADLMKLHHQRLAFSGALAALFREVDLLLIPTQPRADFTLAQEAEEFATTEGLTQFLRFVTPWDMSGSPTITLPGGFTPQGLPVSFQLVGRHLDEALLIRAGHTYQQATDWHRRHPALLGLRWAKHRDQDVVDEDDDFVV
jgi:amidase